MFHLLNSIYIHFPFCNYKCDYCNFFVLQRNHPNFQDNIIQEYIAALHTEIDHWNSTLGKQTIKTIYLGGGTPLLVGAENIYNIIDHIKKIWDLEYLEEITIELNPDPFEETLEFVKQIGKQFPDFHRIRFSFGIQTFDDEILQLSGRSYSYNQLKGYLRSLQSIKSANYCYNFDFIAFGSLSNNIYEEKKQGGLSRNTNKLEFFQNFVHSQTADSFSLYMLELFPGSKWNQVRDSKSEIIDKSLKQCINPDDDKVMEEYSLLSDIIQSAGYNRYEVSNYALPGKQSIHNMIYRTMQPYLGIGASASGFVTQNIEEKITNSQPITHNLEFRTPFRYTNTTILSDYFKGNYKDNQKVTHLADYDILYETFMLGLRAQGVKNLGLFQSILVDNYLEKIGIYEIEGLLWFDGDNLKLTNDGYNVANKILSELLK